ncbi:host cell attachment protein [Agrobacterium sp. a22-2]|uniref:host attachment family protein n=1 Tax=Agrobacterium sp. a22-2 TaxID=2283840 RepID=UPI001446C21D|nr:host attachment protein [Agrobacterium sp. a22-2]NKN35967.1 host cell attachment protein [Agrobacterium sp. a22-2]
MLLPQGTVVAVTDGEKLDLYRNAGIGSELSLAAMPQVSIDDEAKGSGGRHTSTSANPDESQLSEDGFSAGVAQYLNKQVLEGGIDNLVVISAPRSLGELRKHYHKFLSAKLLLEIPKDLTGHVVGDVEKAIQAA